ncbi:MAG: ATP-dependent RecD-like DNA helicase [Deltaproteobacteria bacterium]|jgi:exodeoxyribonuclease V alpha subunit|nr:ATP-dependent RecD-like DNA helicase [Deltaproteobacteria bacterium]
MADKKNGNGSHTQAALDASFALEEISGTLERVLFHNADNGYSVLRLKPHRGLDPFAAVGNMFDPQPGSSLRFQGQWVEHPRFGRQFQFNHYDIILPATTEGIRHYLGSGLIHGVRLRMAGRIVDHFGEETFRILDEEPDRLAEVKGLGLKTLEAIKSAWSEHRSIRSLIMFLQPHGISTSYAVRIFKHYGPDALEVVRGNPYRLAMDIRGIGFLSADAAALKLGVAKDSPLRAEAGVLYTLKKLNDDGHVFYPFDELLQKASEELDIEPDLAGKAIHSLEGQERVVLEELRDGRGNFRCTGVYLAWSHQCEAGISHYLRRILHSPKSVAFPDKEEALRQGLRHTELELGDEQIEAVRAAISGKALVITGGPGTGKTTVINTVIKVFEGRKSKILLAAPTGRAAKRMSETGGREAKTIHRLLEYSPGEDMFARNENNPLACGLLVVDEASMLDTMLMYHLLKAVPLGATLIFVGDVNQLPSVGAGNVLRDIMASGAVPVAQLTEIYRQAAESAIILNAHRINAGEMPLPRREDDALSDFYFIKQEDPEKCADLVVDLVCNHIPRRFKLNPLEDIQVLTPMHKGSAGAIALNAKLQAALNRESGENGASLGRGERKFRLGDKVMQIRNNYEKDVFNGDIGRVCYLNAEERELTVRFEERNVLYSADELDELVQAYAISVHKSQGSEYPAVVMPILTQHYMLLQRNLLYTGVTRGKRLVIVVGAPRALAMAVRNDKTHQRHSWLGERLKA